MHSILIAENLTNDFCNPDPEFTSNRVNLGIAESARLFGDGVEEGNGPLTQFIRGAVEAKRQGLPIGILLVRDMHDAEEDMQSEEFLRFGSHCIDGTKGADFVPAIQDYICETEVINTSSLSVPLRKLRESVLRMTGVDILSTDDRNKETIRFLIAGVHTERMVFSTAHLIRNVLGCPHVAVCPHLVASTSREAHFSALRNSFPDALVDILPDLADAATFLNLDEAHTKFMGGSACLIAPEEISLALTPEQLMICKVLCMHWTFAHLTPLKGGFSGSLLFLAQGWKDAVRTEPMVIKLDRHEPIRREWDGYEKVKDFLGKRIPTLNPPVSFGAYTGVSMDLASMEGHPRTLQSLFEAADSDKGLEEFETIFHSTLSIMSERVYLDTLRTCEYVPFRHYKLHVDLQKDWLDENLDSILKQSFGPTSIDPEAVRRMFRMVHKNPDAVEELVCLSHGDLNLANIICDSRQNVWIIDWTHAGLHPIEMDFAKLENDIKFVISRDFLPDDFVKLQKLEDYLLSHHRLESADDLDHELRFVKWDSRFNRLYRAVRTLRDALLNLRDSEEWFLYRIALLRYSIHTLSFDRRRGIGDCGPVQLWYALYSTEQLLHQLMVDDYFLKIRGERPSEYPVRQRIAVEKSRWEVPEPSYAPPYYVSQTVLANDQSISVTGWADPENDFTLGDSLRNSDGIQRDNLGRPLNPTGRTGIAGRGLLGRWGPNPMVHAVVIRSRGRDDELTVLVTHEDDDQIRMPEDHVLRNESYDDRARELLENMFAAKLDLAESVIIHDGYIYDARQTDHAWVESRCYLLFVAESSHGRMLINDSRETNVWRPLNPPVINSLPACDSALVREALDLLGSNGVVNEALVQSILNATG